VPIKAPFPAFIGRDGCRRPSNHGDTPGATSIKIRRPARSGAIELGTRWHDRDRQQSKRFQRPTSMGPILRRNGPADRPGHVPRPTDSSTFRPAVSQPVANAVAQVPAVLLGVVLIEVGSLEAFQYRHQRWFSMFRIRTEDADLVRLWVLNLGFYNIVYGLGVIAGVMLTLTGLAGGIGIGVFVCISHIVFAMVLLIVDRTLRRNSVYEAILPVTVLIALPFGLTPLDALLLIPLAAAAQANPKPPFREEWSGAHRLTVNATRTGCEELAGSTTVDRSPLRIRSTGRCMNPIVYWPGRPTCASILFIRRHGWTRTLRRQSSRARAEQRVRGHLDRTPTRTRRRLPNRDRCQAAPRRTHRVPASAAKRPLAAQREISSRSAVLSRLSPRGRDRDLRSRVLLSTQGRVDRTSAHGMAVAEIGDASRRHPNYRRTVTGRSTCESTPSMCRQAAIEPISFNPSPASR
jgi:putative membrane protein